jgi:hypothetical protein
LDGPETSSAVRALRPSAQIHSNRRAGFHGGYNLTTGSYNIDIGNPGVAAESGIIRIGTAGTQTSAYIAGIDDSQVTGAAVYVTASGQLGVLASSGRYKTAIAPIGASTRKLQDLRPVRFHLKANPQGAVQYGLIAEEVDRVYPELVIRYERGVVQGVRYDELAPLLLDVVQQQQRKLVEQDKKLAQVIERDSALQRQVNALIKINPATQAALAELQTQGRRVASR